MNGSAAFLDTALIVLVQLVMLVGWFGVLVPGFPGLVVIWLAALGYGLISAFSTLGIVLFVLITLLMIAGTILDNFLVGAGAYKGGASWLSVAVALIAFAAGTIVFPPFGGIIAAPLSILVIEVIRRRDIQQAWLAVRGTAAGLGLAFALQFGVGFLMILIWWLWVWKG